MPSLAQGLEFITYTNTASVQVVYPLYTSTGQTLVYKSIQAQGDGYFGSPDGLHTVMYTYDSNFIGTITMQATLATEPQESDWFDIEGTTLVQTSSSAFFSYNNLDVLVQSQYYNFTGNFVWVRGYVAIENGQVESILYNH
jgi:hypothetical protein